MQTNFNEVYFGLFLNKQMKYLLQCINMFSGSNAGEYIQQ